MVNYIQVWADITQLSGISADRLPNAVGASQGCLVYFLVHFRCVLSSCVQVFAEPTLKKAKLSVDKALNFSRRERMFISRYVLTSHSYSIRPICA